MPHTTIMIASIATKSTVAAVDSAARCGSVAVGDGRGLKKPMKRTDL